MDLTKPTLYLFSFGGGNAASFAKLQERLEPTIHTRTFEMPGKGKRIKEPMLRNLHLMVQEHLEQLDPLPNPPYAFFGHSMGCYVAHLLIQQLQKQGKPLPQHVFYSSKVAPSRNYDKKRSLLSDEEFVEKLRILKGMPDAILENPELLRIFLPMVRNDFYAIDTYRYRPGPPYPVDMSVFCGSEEVVDDQELLDWKKEHTGKFHFERRPGHHFWLFNELDWLGSYILRTLGHGK